ncbi:MAG: hypothetical protein PVG63_03020 [Anaerolineales bacterium]
MGRLEIVSVVVAAGLNPPGTVGNRQLLIWQVHRFTIDEWTG